jgi:sirohydrochlorin cobaltochelatase
MISDELACLMKRGFNTLGELEFVETPDGYRLYHWSDREFLQSARRYHASEDAREIAKYDVAGAYRPLKGAPNLPTGWVLELATIQELQRALDYFYPGAIATWIAYQAGKAEPVSLRETVNRQSGMYRVTRKLTDDQARKLVREACNSKNHCLRTILWGIEPGRTPDFLPPSKSDPTFDQTGRHRPAIPFLCLEACNLLIARGRTMLKRQSE